MPIALGRHDLQIVRRSNRIGQRKVAIAIDFEMRFELAIRQLVEAARAIDQLLDLLVQRVIKELFEESHRRLSGCFLARDGCEAVTGRNCSRVGYGPRFSGSGTQVLRPAESTRTARNGTIGPNTPSPSGQAQGDRPDNKET